MTITGNTSINTNYGLCTNTSITGTASVCATPFPNGGIYVRTESDFRDLERKLKEEQKRAESLEIEITQIKIKYTQKKSAPTAKRIFKNGDYMTILWEDGTKTIVKRAEDEADNDYAAFTAALGIKLYGSNSALKRVVRSAEVQKPKKKKEE